MSETTTEQGGQERRVGPTVSRDKWANHAKIKLTRGYVLIVATDKRRANFWLREKGYEMCAFDVARNLIAAGEIIPVGEHHLGTMYGLAPEAPPPTLSPKSRSAKAASAKAAAGRAATKAAAAAAAAALPDEIEEAVLQNAGDEPAPGADA